MLFQTLKQGCQAYFHQLQPRTVFLDYKAHLIISITQNIHNNLVIHQKHFW